MPEGHSIHRLAGAFRDSLQGQVLHASSPQGRFAQGAARLDGQRLVQARAHGKHLFLGFAPADSAFSVSLGEGGVSVSGEVSGEEGMSTWEPDAKLTWLHVHLGIYGSWRFTGDAQFTAPQFVGAPRSQIDALSSSVLLGQDGDTRTLRTTRAATHTDDLEAGTHLETATVAGDLDADLEPVELRVHQVWDASKMIAYEDFADRWFLAPGSGEFRASEPIGAVRLRLAGEHGVADLSGPNTCELLDAAGVAAVLGRLGPDPLSQPRSGFAAFRQACARRRKAIGEALMDQAVLAGVGNIYRAEVLFAARLSPHVPAAEVSAAKLRRIWDWLVEQMPRGVATGRITTMDPSDYASFVQTHPEVLEGGDGGAGAGGAGGEEADPVAQRYYVYQREGRICLRCGRRVRMEVAAGRKLYYCPGCQR